MMHPFLSRALWWLAVLLVAVGALAFRLPRLDQRPMHGDEANQAVRTGMLLDTGVYRYDPNDHHGPSLYFAALPFCRATAATFTETTEWNYRLVPVAFAVLTLLLMTGLVGRDDAGIFTNRCGLFVALLLTAVSPVMVYYSRFFIQETMFVSFLTGLLLCAVRYVRWRSEMSCGRAGLAGRRSAAWAIGFGAFAGLAAATKETVVLSIAAAAVAAVAACGFKRLWNGLRWRDVCLAVGAAALVAVVLFSSFFTYPYGVYDAVFSTVKTYFFRATAVPEHQHPWDFYLKTIFWFKYGKGPIWSEAGLLLPAAIAACWAFFKARARWVRFVAVYTLVLTAIYSMIPYKTPWCALSFLHGYILLAGVGVGDIIDWLGRFPKAVRIAGMTVIAVLIGALTWRHSEQARRACFKYPADLRNPYVYAHTSVDAMNLVAEIERVAHETNGYDTLIAVALPTPDTWPLPWYLRKYRNVGYWTTIEDIPQGFEPTVVIAAMDQGDVADERFGAGKRASFFGIRPGVLLNVFVPNGVSSR